MSEPRHRVLPESWSVVKFDEIADFKNGLNFTKAQKGSKGILTVDVLNMYSDGVFLDLDKLYRVDKNPSKDLKLRYGDVLFVRSSVKREGVGYPAAYRNSLEEPVTYCGFIIRARSMPSLVNPEFLTYFFRSPDARERVIADSSQVTITNINQKRLGSQRVPLAPRGEQERIVAKIEELFTKLDAGVEALEKAKRLLEKYRQSVLKAAVEGKLTQQWREEHKDEIEPAFELLKRILAERRKKWEEEQLAKYEAKGKKPPKGWRERYKEPKGPDTNELPSLPKGWRWVKVEQLSWSSRYGTSARCGYKADGPPVLRIPNIQSGAISYEDLKFASSKTKLGSLSPLSRGDLLVIRTNGSRNLIGRAAVVRESPQRPTYFASYLIRFRLIDRGATLPWLNLVWNSSLIRNQVFDNSATSAGQYNLSQTNIQQFSLPLPPEREQEEILSLVDKDFSATDLAFTTLRTELSRERNLRQSILKTAFEGRLVPQDPDDEPASRLLERIKAEKKKRKK